jgi:hypothetical protein
LDCGVLTPLWFFVFCSAEQQLDVKTKAASKQRSPKIPVDRASAWAGGKNVKVFVLQFEGDTMARAVCGLRMFAPAATEP